MIYLSHVFMIYNYIIYKYIYIYITGMQSASWNQTLGVEQMPSQNENAPVAYIRLFGCEYEFFECHLIHLHCQPQLAHCLQIFGCQQAIPICCCRFLVRGTAGSEKTCQSGFLSCSMLYCLVPESDREWATPLSNHIKSRPNALENKHTFWVNIISTYFIIFQLLVPIARNSFTHLECKEVSLRMFKVPSFRFIAVNHSELWSTTWIVNQRCWNVQIHTFGSNQNLTRFDSILVRRWIRVSQWIQVPNCWIVFP